MGPAPRRSVPVIALTVALLAGTAGCSDDVPETLGTPPATTAAATTASPPASAAPPVTDCGGQATHLAVAGTGRDLTATVVVCRPLSGADQYWIVAEPAGDDGKPSGHYYPKGKTGSSGTSQVSVTLSADTDRPSTRFFYVVKVPAGAVPVMQALLDADAQNVSREALPAGVVPASPQVRSTYE